MIGDWKIGHNLKYFLLDIVLITELVLTEFVYSVGCHHKLAFFAIFFEVPSIF